MTLLITGLAVLVLFPLVMGLSLTAAPPTPSQDVMDAIDANRDAFIADCIASPGHVDEAHRLYQLRADGIRVAS